MKPNNDASTPDLMKRLEQAVDGLLYPSESDAPLHVFVWCEPVPFSLEALLACTGHDPSTPVRTTNLDSFFRPVTTPRAWHGPEEQERTRRFTALRELLEAKLSDIQIYKVGTITIDVYIVGHDADGNILGLTTNVVET